VDRLSIQQRFIDYFIAMGAHKTPSQEELDHSIVSFQLDNDQISLSVLTANDMIQRNRIIETLLHAFSSRSPGTRFYVAAPKLLGATLDAQIFRSHGIGLLLFDDRMIEETVTPTVTPAQPQIRTAASTSRELPLPPELATLKSAYLDLVRKMDQMIADIKSWKENAPGPAPASPLVQGLEDTSFESPAFSVIPLNSLPTFFADNPWLDVLSRRGKPEVAQFAG